MKGWIASFVSAVFFAMSVLVLPVATMAQPLEKQVAHERQVKKAIASKKKKRKKARHHRKMVHKKIVHKKIVHKKIVHKKAVAKKRHAKPL